MNRLRDVLSRSILAGMFTVLSAFIVGPLVFLLGSSTQWDVGAVNELLMWSIVSATLAVMFVAALILLFFLPLRVLISAPIPVLVLIGSTALAGGIVASVPWIFRNYHDQIFGLTPLVQPTPDTAQFITMIQWVGAGIFLGGIYAATYTIIERREHRLHSDLRVSKGIGLWVNAIAAFALPLLLIYMFTTPLRMITFARVKAVRNQAAILEEAQKLLDQAALTEDGSFSIGFDKPMPPHLAKLGQTATVTLRQPDAVKVQVTGGFTHYGLYIIPKETTATKEWLQNDARKLKRVNPFIYQFDDEA